MCGISLIIDQTDRSIDSSLIKQMNDKVKHRGPNGEGSYMGKQFAIGHRRLAIVDLSEAGAQPMQKNNDCISFNGMLYNYLELRAELSSYGYQFNSNSDTEVVLASCQHWGEAAFLKFNGMWAFIWYKSISQEIILSRDHYGIKPLYYTKVENYFAAASEIKQFIDLPGFTPVLNKKVTVNFIVHGSLNHSTDTFFENVSELKGGHTLVYNLKNHNFKVKSWYCLSKIVPLASVTVEKAAQEVRSLLIDSIRIRMRADVSIGSCLSGGVDSSSIVSLVHSNHMAQEDFTTITSCYTDKMYDEQLYSDMVTKQTQFKEIKVFPDLNHLMDKNDLDLIIYHQDQPFGTASHYSEYQVFKKANCAKIKVMLDGQGADEYLCGYDEYFITYLKQLFHSGKILKAFQEISQKSKHDHIHKRVTFKNYFKTAYYYPWVLKLKPLLGLDNTPWLNEKWKNIARENEIKYNNENIAALSLQQMVQTSLPLQLHSEDRNSMMFSIESRLPFLDFRLMEYIYSLPAELKINKGFSKYVLREAIIELPKEIQMRTHKMGFVAPDEFWVKENHQAIRKELQQFIDSTNIFSNVLIHRFDRFIKGNLKYESIYFRALTLLRFIKVFKIKITS